MTAAPVWLHAARQLRAVAVETADAAPVQTCSCPVGPCAGWESIAEERWPRSGMRQVATLRDPDLDEPTFEEHHPAGTRYDSPDAPVAPAFFPYNRCDLFRCDQCARLLLRYTEFGGYYVDHRVRALREDLIVD